MRRLLVGLALAAVVAVPLAAAQGSRALAKFDGGIGVIPVSNVTVSADGLTVTVSRNTVRGVLPAGQLWVIERLTGSVDEDGGISIDGRGLLFGGGNNIGRSNNVNVRAVFSCDATTSFTSETVQLDDNGDFRIGGTLENQSPDPAASDTLPNPCPNPVLLIVNAGSGAWFAAGIPKF